MVTLNGKKIALKGINVTFAEVHKIYDDGMNTKVSAVLPAWNKGVLVTFPVPKTVKVEKGARLMVEANLGALYVEDVLPRFVEKASA